MSGGDTEPESDDETKLADYSRPDQYKFCVKNDKIPVTSFSSQTWIFMNPLFDRKDPDKALLTIVREPTEAVDFVVTIDNFGQGIGSLSSNGIFPEIDREFFQRNQTFLEGLTPRELSALITYTHFGDRLANLCMRVGL